jgi:nucleoside-triphosphatase
MTTIVVTGPPKMGKTTIMMSVANKLKDKGINVGGIVSREIRINYVRTGFEFIDVATNDRDVLATVTGNGPKVGKYYVKISGCRFAAGILTDINQFRYHNL